MRFTDDEWHVNNPTFAKHWLGMDNWSQFKVLVQCTWPSVKFPTESLAERIKMPNPSMSELEQCMVARMRLRKGMGYEGVCTLWGRSDSSIGNYCKKWVPKWGFAGQDYSILDLTLKYIEQTLPAEFITNGLADVCALVT